MEVIITMYLFGALAVILLIGWLVFQVLKKRGIAYCHNDTGNWDDCMTRMRCDGCPHCYADKKR